ncbi:MAG: FG-GAP-like repeat-containing protein, partial [bacterium]
VNNNKSLIELQIQTPGGEKPFTKKEIVLDLFVASLVAADLNGDGKTDIAVAGEPPEVKIFYQGEGGAFETPTKLEIEGRWLLTFDANGDSRSDLLVLSKDKLRLLLQTANGLEAEDDPLINSFPPASDPRLVDLNSDSRPDLIYRTTEKSTQLVARLSEAAGKFGPEQVFDIGETFDLAPVKSGESKGQSLWVIESKTRVLEEMLLQGKTNSGDKDRIEVGNPRYFSLDPEIRSDQESLAVGDLNADGRSDIVVASPSAAEVAVMLQSADGKLRASSYPSLAGIREVLIPPSASKTELTPLLALSRDEETISLVRYVDGSGLGAPQPLALSVKPLAMAIGNLDGDQDPDLLFCSKTESGELTLAYLPHFLKGKPGETKPVALTLPESLGEEPRALTVGDVNNDGYDDVIIFFEYQPLRILLRGPDGDLTPFAANEGFKRGLFNKVEPSQLIVDDYDMDGRNEILVAKNNFVRALSLLSNGDLEVEEQFNGKTPRSNITSVVSADLTGDGHKEIAIVDDYNNVITLYSFHEGKGFQLERHLETADIRGRRLVASDMNGDARPDLVLLGREKLAILYVGESPTELQSVRRHQTDTDDEGVYSLAASGALLANGRDQLIALENKNRLLEFFEFAPDDPAPKRFYKFKVFDGDNLGDQDSARRRNPPEPREVRIGDLDGDGKGDLLLLTHNNVLIYFQRSAPEEAQ